MIISSKEIDKALDDPKILEAAKQAHIAWCDEQERQTGKRQNEWEIVVNSGYGLRLNVAATLAVKKILVETME